MDDFTPEEASLIVGKIQEFMAFYSVTRLGRDAVLPPFTVSEVDQREKELGFELPKAFKHYITKVSREFWHNKYGFRVVFDLDEIKPNTSYIYLNGESCSNHNTLVLKPRSFGKVRHQIANNNSSRHPRIVFNNFKYFVMGTLNL